MCSRSARRSRSRRSADGAAGTACSPPAPLVEARSGGRCRARGRPRDLHLCPAAVRELRRRLGGGQGALVEVDRDPARDRRDQHRDLRAAVDGCAAGSAIPPGPDSHPGVNGFDLPRARRACRWGRALGGNPPRLGFQRRSRHPGGDADGDLEPARDPGLPHGRIRRADAQRRQRRGVTDGRGARIGRLPRRRRCVCGRDRERTYGLEDRRLRRARRQPSPQARPPGTGRVGRTQLRQVPRARSGSFGGAGTSSP